MRIFSRIVLESESAAGRPIVRLAPRRLLTEPLLFPPNGRDVQHVVPADEAVAVLRLELPVHVLLGGARGEVIRGARPARVHARSRTSSVCSIAMFM